MTKEEFEKIIEDTHDEIAPSIILTEKTKETIKDIERILFPEEKNMEDK